MSWCSCFPLGVNAWSFTHCALQGGIVTIIIHKHARCQIIYGMYQSELVCRIVKVRAVQKHHMRAQRKGKGKAGTSPCVRGRVLAMFAVQMTHVIGFVILSSVRQVSDVSILPLSRSSATRMASTAAKWKGNRGLARRFHRVPASMESS